MTKSISQKILDILFPIKCLSCGAKDITLCNKCLDSVDIVLQKHGATTISIFSYRNAIIKKALRALKYNNNKEIGEIFARILYDEILEDLSDRQLFSNFKNPLLIPIPLSKKRLRERGFNQSGLIAREISHLDNNTSFTFTESVLYKIKDTPSQVSIKDKAERLKNLHGCFSVKDKKVVCGKNIIIIDDVTTTGATIAEARKTLLSAGAKKVIAFTVAH